MTLRRGRLVARLGVAALLVGGALTIGASPAQAEAGVDLAVTLSGEKVSAGSAGKVIFVKVANAGDAKVEGFDLSIELNGTSALDIELPDEYDEFCKRLVDSKIQKIQCALGNVLVKGDSLSLPIIATPNTDAPGLAGTIKVAVSSDQEPPANRANNTASVSIEITKPGADIQVWASDVAADYNDTTGEAKPVTPGAIADLEFGLANAGGIDAVGIEFKLQLPEHVTFVEGLGGCTLTADKRALTCSGPEVTLPVNRYFAWVLPVKVSSTAPGPVNLTGSMEGRGLGGERNRTLVKTEAKDVPAWAKATQNDFNPNEIDERDNKAQFTVFVGAPSGTGGGTGGTGGGGGLPITGAKAALIGGVGVAVLVVGGVLFVVARRRRIVLVNPSE